MKTAAAYIRVSTDEQLEFSPASQLAQIRRFAAANGYSLPTEFIFLEEDGRSGRYSQSRPAFLRMIAAAKQIPKPFDAILVWKYSRFARNRQDSIVYKSMLRKQLGIDVLSVSEQLGDNKMSIITEAVIEAMDEFYSVNLAEEVTRGMAQKARQGQPMTYAPFGYLLQGKHYLPDPQTAPLVQSIFSDFLAGMSCLQIAQKLSALQVRTRFGNPLRSRNISYILQNPLYVGKIRWHSGSAVILSEGEHPPLVTKAIWEQAQERLQLLRTIYPKKAKPSVKAQQEFALRGLVRCSSCGETLVKSSRGYLQCGGYARGKCSDSHAIRSQQLEELVWAALRTDFAGSVLQLPSRKKGDCSNLIGSQIAWEEKKLQRARAAYEAGVDSLEEYRQEKENLTASIRRLQQQLQSAPAPQKELFSGPVLLCDLLSGDQLTSSEKNRILRAIIQSITFDRKKNQIKIYYYS